MALMSQGTQVPLNTEFVKEQAALRWGAINHPTLLQIAQMLLRAAVKSGKEDVVLWKTDIKEAFTLLRVRPEDCRLLGCEMFEGWVYVMLAGMFGLSLMPAVFEVVTRVLRVLVAIAIDGEAKIYVDDVMGASGRSSWERDRDKAVEQVQMLGKDAEAVEKRESSEDNEGRKVDCLGWEFNLGEWVVDVAEENRMKALYPFWTTDLESSVTLETMEALVSMA